MKYLIGLLLIGLTIQVYGQDITINTGAYLSKVSNARPDYPSELNFRNGHGVHINVEYNKIEYSLPYSQIFGLEWRKYSHDMSLFMKDIYLFSGIDGDEMIEMRDYYLRNGTYNSEALALQYGVRYAIQTKKSHVYEFDALVLFLHTYKTNFKGEAYNWSGIEDMNEAEDLDDNPNDQLQGYSPFQFGGTLRAGVNLPLKENMYLKLQGFVSSSLWSSVFFRYDVVDLSMLNYGLNIGLTFE